MSTQNNGHKLHVDGSFAMEFVVAGQDEHGLPLLEVNFYPVVIEGMVGDVFASALDGQHLLANFTVPLEEAGLTRTELDSLPLCEGWATISTAYGSGLRVEDLEGAFGARAAVIVFKALADALLSERINADWNGTPYRSTELDEDNHYEEVLAMAEHLQNRIEADEERQVTRTAFNGIMKREFSL